jgi:hypothetical protein
MVRFPRISIPKTVPISFIIAQAAKTIAKPIKALVI